MCWNYSSISASLRPQSYISASTAWFTARSWHWMAVWRVQLMKAAAAGRRKDGKPILIMALHSSNAKPGEHSAPRQGCARQCALRVRLQPAHRNSTQPSGRGLSIGSLLGNYLRSGGGLPPAPTAAGERQCRPPRVGLPSFSMLFWRPADMKSIPFPHHVGFSSSQFLEECLTVL